MDEKMKICENCGHCTITPRGRLHNEDVCDVCYGHKNWVPKYSCKEEKEMKKYEIIIRTNIQFTRTIEAESRDKAVSLALDTLDGTYFKPCGMHDYAYGTKEYLRMDDVMACKEIETKKPLILLCGKSGSGKTTVVDLLCRKYGLKQLESCTTRPPRKDGESGHIFTNLSLFEQHVREGKVIAQAGINGYKYWATKDQLDSSDIYVIDPKTALELEKKVNGEREVIIVYLCCSDTTRVYRMTKRGDALEDIQKRSANEKCWDEYISSIDYKRQRFDSGEYDAEHIAESIMLVYNFCLTGEWG